MFLHQATGRKTGIPIVRQVLGVNARIFAAFASDEYSSALAFYHCRA